MSKLPERRPDARPSGQRNDGRRRGPPQSAGTAARNIESILRIEKEDEEQLLLHHRALHAVGQFVGTPYFFIVQCLSVGLWLFLNIHPSLRVFRFDEYPFPFLSLILALEAVLLTSCVLIRQNIADQASERRNHLDLQINLLAERESTAALDILRQIAEHLKCPAGRDAQSEELADETRIDAIAQDLRAREKQHEDRADI